MKKIILFLTITFYFLNANAQNPTDTVGFAARVIKLSEKIKLISDRQSERERGGALDLLTLDSIVKAFNCKCVISKEKREAMALLTEQIWARSNARVAEMANDLSLTIECMEENEELKRIEALIRSLQKQQDKGTKL